jgi:hypothetical protein
MKSGCQGRGTRLISFTLQRFGANIMSGTYRRTVKLYWVKNKSRGRIYTRPVLKIVIPQNVIERLGVNEGEKLVYDL